VFKTIWYVHYYLIVYRYEIIETKESAELKIFRKMYVQLSLGYLKAKGDPPPPTHNSPI
jgi:hypothetical protein